MAISLLKNLTIKHKLTVIIMTTVAVALFGAFTTCMTWDFLCSKTRILQTLSTEAGIIADNAKVSLAFKDKADARQVLSSLEKEKSVILACVYDADGRVFATYRRSDIGEKVALPTPRRNSQGFEKGNLYVFRPVVLDGQEIGTIYLRADLDNLRRTFEKNLAVAAILAAVLFITASFLSARLQKVISGPILRLAETATKIGRGELDSRIEIESNDELGRLAAAFNNMAEKLKQSYSSLEEKVRERTADLQAANERLKVEIEKRQQAQAQLEENIRFLNCHYIISKLAEQPNMTLKTLFEQATELIRKAQSHPELTCVRITYDGVPYKTANFKKSEICEHAEIRINGSKAGDIEVYRLSDGMENNQAKFFREKRHLLDSTAWHLSRIAERTRATEQLALFRNLLDHSNDAIFVLESKWGRLLDVNNRACQSLGYTRSELLKLTIKDIEETVPDDSHWDALAEKLKVKGNLVIEGRHIRKDGSAFATETSLTFARADGQDYIIAVTRDVTERKEAERQIKRSLQTQDVLNKLLTLSLQDYTLQQILEQSIRLTTSVPWLSFESRGAIFLADDTKKTLEMKAQHGLPCSLQSSCACVEFGKCICGRAASSRQIQFCSQIDERHERICKELPNHGHYCVPILSDGDLLGVLDIYVEQGHKQNEEEENFLKAVAAVLAGIMERKRAEEKQAKLLKEVESANQELKDFAYIVSHDLKAPLFGIKTVAEWICTDYAEKLGEDGKEQLRILMQQVERMYKLIDGVLQYSRVGRAREERMTIDLNKLVSDIVDTLAVPEHITITIENPLPVIEADLTRITQLFQNLLSNAVKYMDKPKGWIRLGSTKENGCWKFSVADNGPGIEEKNFERIFQIFQSPSPKKDVESTGVGLTIVKKIVESYGGQIWVESEPGKGSTFFFTLPRTEKEAENEKPKAHITC